MIGIAFMVVAILAGTNAELETEEVQDFYFDIEGLDWVDNPFIRFDDFDVELFKNDPFFAFRMDKDMMETVPEDWDPSDVCEKYADEAGVEPEYEDDEIIQFFGEEDPLEAIGDAIKPPNIHNVFEQAIDLGKDFFDKIF